MGEYESTEPFSRWSVWETSTPRSSIFLHRIRRTNTYLIQVNDIKIRISRSNKKEVPHRTGKNIIRVAGKTCDVSIGKWRASFRVLI